MSSIINSLETQFVRRPLSNVSTAKLDVGFSNHCDRVTLAGERWRCWKTERHRRKRHETIKPIRDDGHRGKRTVFPRKYLRAYHRGQRNTVRAAGPHRNGAARDRPQQQNVYGRGWRQMSRENSWSPGRETVVGGTLQYTVFCVVRSHLPPPPPPPSGSMTSTQNRIERPRYEARRLRARNNDCDVSPRSRWIGLWAQNSAVTTPSHNAFCHPALVSFHSSRGARVYGRPGERRVYK